MWSDLLVDDVPAMMIDVAAAAFAAAAVVHDENVSDVAVAAAGVAMIRHHSPTADCVPVHF